MWYTAIPEVLKCEESGSVSRICCSFIVLHLVTFWVLRYFLFVHDRCTQKSDSLYVSELNFHSVWQRVVEQSFDGTRGHIGKNVCLAEEFNSYLRNTVTDLEMKAAEQLHSETLMLFVKVSALYVLNCNLFGAADKKLFRQLWDLNKRVTCYTWDFAIFSL